MDSSESRPPPTARPADAADEVSPQDPAQRPTGNMLRTIRPHAFEAAGPSTHRGHRRIGTVVWRWARLAVLVGLMLFGAAVALLAVFRFVDPPFTAFTVAQSLSGGRVTQQWVPLDGISPHLLRAVISSEDAKFCTHFGVDLGEIEAAIERARGGIPRGASTISMQVIKNLFLWQGKSYIRKAIEIPLTLVMEQLWPKTRILEVYLNIAEWGPGVYGAEAAAQFHFEKPASRLTEREAALLAVALPNPAMRDAGDPGPGTQRLADRILTRMKVVGRNISCVERSGASQRRGTAPRHAT